jgi:phospholipase/carboxylesterase
VVVILLHGYGANKQDLSGLATTLSGTVPGVRFILPEAPHRTSRGFTWIPAFRADSKEELDAELQSYRATARQIVTDIIDDLVDDGVAPGNIYVGGFSQGGGVALDVVLEAPAAASIAGLIHLSGASVATDLSPLATHAPVRAFVSHSERDANVKYKVATQLVDALETGGHAVTFVSFEGGHSVPVEVIQALRDFLQAHFE